jgi:polyisoprenoid-binding protein YceI
MKKIILSIALLASVSATQAQKYFTRNGHLGFFSKTNMEDIKANNESVTYIVDWTTGEIQISALQTNFKFEKALMQEHYNENYVESTKFPKATFKGKIENVNAINIKKDGTYTANVSGSLDIHGVSKYYTTKATFKVSGGHVVAETKFNVKCADHNIKIEANLKNNISESIEISAKADLTELKK